MRLYSWSGLAALAAAALAGYFTSEAVHSDRGRPDAEPMIGFMEASNVIDLAAPGKLPTLPAEEIDLTCLPQKPPEEVNRHTSEPPLADGPGVIRAAQSLPDDAEFTVESGLLVPGRIGGPELPPPPSIPYLTDDAPPAPAQLPMTIGDANDSANAYPVRQCSPPPSGPIWDAVSKFFADAAKLLPSAHVDQPPALPGEESDWYWDARWRPMCDPDATNPNLGKPPTGELHQTPEVGGRCPGCPR